MTSKKWFVTKRYGWGWTPVTWQGWAVTALFVAFELCLSVFIGNSFDTRAGSTVFLFFTFLASLALIYICTKKGEPPRWRWGD